MRVLILGATGKTGRELVRQAVESGHTVTAFVRNPGKFEIEDENLKVVQGNILDRPSLERAMLGHEAVISALGSPGLRKSTDLSDGTRNIVAAMESSGVRRLVFESSIGVGDSRNHLGLFAKWVFFPLVIRNIIADKEIQERYIKESSLDWIIVRPGRLTNGRQTGKYRVGDEINEHAVGSSISRSDTAEFMLRQLTDGTYLRQTPAVSY